MQLECKNVLFTPMAHAWSINFWRIFFFLFFGMSLPKKITQKYICFFLGKDFTWFLTKRKNRHRVIKLYHKIISFYSSLILTKKRN